MLGYTDQHGVNIFLPVERVLWAASLIVQAAIVLRIFQHGLFSRYGFFATYLAVETIASLFLINFGITSRHYAAAFRYAEISFLVLRAGVAFELWERICDHFPGVGAWRFLLGACFLAIGTTAACFTFWPDLCAQWGFPQTTAIVLQRVEGEVYPVAFILMWVLVRHVISHERPLRPNVTWHWKLLLVYFSTSGIASLLVLWTGGGAKVFPINSGMLAIDLLCLVTWLRVIRRSGEELPEFERMTVAEIAVSRLRHRDLIEMLRWLPARISARIRAGRASG